MEGHALLITLECVYINDSPTCGQEKDKRFIVLFDYLFFVFQSFSKIKPGTFLCDKICNF